MTNTLRFFLTACLVTAGSLSAQEAAEKFTTRKEGREAARFSVDAMASKNRQPAFRDYGLKGMLPEFPKDYDWEEQERVIRAIERAMHDIDEETWRTLVRGGGDQRYALTVVFKDERAMNYTVGDVCKRLAWCKICEVCSRRFRFPADVAGKSPTIDLGVSKPWEWMKARLDRPLFEVQIEICELALTASSTERGIPKDLLESAADEVRREIAELRRRKQPIALEAGFRCIPYTSHRAANDLRRVEGKSVLHKFGDDEIPFVLTTDDSPAGFEDKRVMPADMIWFENPYFKLLTREEIAADDEKGPFSRYSGELGSYACYIHSGNVVCLQDGKVYSFDEYRKAMTRWNSVLDTCSPDKKPAAGDFKIRRRCSPVVEANPAKE